MRRVDVPRVVVSARAPARAEKTRTEPALLPVRRAAPAAPLYRCPACRAAFHGPAGRTLGAAFDGRLECAACGEMIGVLPDSTPDSLFAARATGGPARGVDALRWRLLPQEVRRVLAARFGQIEHPVARAIAGVLLLALDLAAGGAVGRSTLVPWKRR